MALGCENAIVSNYLLSRDDFLLSDLMPRPRDFPTGIYKTHREKSISRVSKSVESKGLEYARMVSADIEKILKAEEPEVTDADIEALCPLVGKITAMDWVGDAQVSSDDFTKGQGEQR